MGFNLGHLKSFAKNLGVEVGVNMVRGWLNEHLKDVTPSDLYETIINNKDLWSLTPSEVKGEGIKLKGTWGPLFEKYEHLITTELLLQWMHEDHPSLFSTIINVPAKYGPDAGIIWFDRQVQNIKSQIIDM